MAQSTEACGAGTLDEYTNAMADVGGLAHGRAYAPGFFSAGALFFVRNSIPDWGLGESNGRSMINLAALVTRR